MRAVLSFPPHGRIASVGLVAALSVFVVACGGLPSHSHRTPSPAGQQASDITPHAAVSPSSPVTPPATPSPRPSRTPAPAATPRPTAAPAPTPTPRSIPTATPRATPRPTPTATSFNEEFSLEGVNNTWEYDDSASGAETIEFLRDGRVVDSCGFYEDIGPDECAWTGLNIGGLYATGVPVTWTAAVVNPAGQILLTSNAITVTTVQPSGSGDELSCANSAMAGPGPSVTLCIGWIK